MYKMKLSVSGLGVVVVAVLLTSKTGIDSHFGS